MSCLVKLASGCPTDGRTMVHGHVICAVTLAVTASVLPGDPDNFVGLPAHVFAWSKIAVRWMFFKGHLSYWALRDQ